jgi:methyltransferase (TIGR00027 family)
MREGAPSQTARRVAAYRLGFERLPAPSGDPDADERLARDVAVGAEFTPSERMERYLRARTAFFDRAVVGSLEREVRQIAAIGAGFDGRALRYAGDGVRWFELDHRATQADKLERLERLGIDPSAITFVALDLALGGTDEALIGAGWEPDAPSTYICEGVAVYLEREWLARLFTDLRRLATAGTRFAISLSPPGASAERRDRFREVVAGLGEPARSELDPEAADELIDRARWRRVELSERAAQAGFTVLAPEWVAPERGAKPTASTVGRYLEGLFHRDGTDRLPRHLADHYGIAVKEIKQLDVGVFRVIPRTGTGWIARVLPASRPMEQARGDAEILRELERHGFPAERPATPEPITELDGQAVLVTERVLGRRPDARPWTFETLGELAGRLHTLELCAGADGAAGRPGGGWHHLVDQGGPRAEVDALIALLDAAAARVPGRLRGAHRELVAAAAAIELCEGLPEALIHPDVAPVNAIEADGGLTLVDWTGAGRGPRLWSLGFLLWTAQMSGDGAVDAVGGGYSRHADLEPAELERLAGAIAARPLVFACWGFATGREKLDAAAAQVPEITAAAERIAARYRLAPWSDRP